MNGAILQSYHDLFDQNLSRFHERKHVLEQLLSDDIEWDIRDGAYNFIQSQAYSGYDTADWIINTLRGKMEEMLEETINSIETTLEALSEVEKGIALWQTSDSEQ